ncbi:putative membrane protein [Arboricoccus pini]|uniref:Putative membrane protein n=1 Tax=Arboricoccus pini TaxID=1963835 RepID=A0A212Q313_9PROT|nr:bestrophin family ion channel [Arboricoccus pini]SNB53643.1 putative membrane protein [Arboricoccus pini]
MIVRRRHHWLRMLFVWNGSVLRQILPRLVVVILISFLAVAGHLWLHSQRFTLNPTPFSLLGITLAIFLGFRNSTSYERYAEGRQLWGQLIIAARSLLRQAATLTIPPLTSTEQARLATRLVELATELKDQLRRSDRARDATLPKVAPSARPSSSRHVLAVAEDLAALRREGRLEPLLVPAMEANLDRIAAVIGGCERIAGTPIPYTYSVMLHRTVYIYCMLLPFGLVGGLELLTPLITAFIAYTFMALEATASELEDPFGLDANDLPLDALTRTLERSLLDMAGVEELPPELEPDANYILT